MQRLNRALYDKWRQNGFTFVDNGADTENDLWVDGIHLQESGKHIIVNNLINNFNHSLESVNPLRWYLWRKVLCCLNLKVLGKVLYIQIKKVTLSNTISHLEFMLYIKLGNSWNYMPPILFLSSAKCIATQILVIAKLNEKEDFILRGFVCDIIRPYKELPVQC